MLRVAILCAAAATVSTVYAHGAHHHNLITRGVPDNLPGFFAPAQVFEEVTNPATVAPGFSAFSFEEPEAIAKAYI
ncbi:hypothetical protein HDU67_004016, partial [Dinochytrium kinnereticum]